MTKIKWELTAMLLAIMIIVGACGPAQTPEPEPTAAPTATPIEEEPTATATEAGAPVTEEPTDESLVSDSSENPAICKLAPLPELPVPPVDETDHIKGDPDAEITLFEYSDFQCPGCGGMVPVIMAFLEDNPDVKLVYRHFPLDFHELAPLTAEAAEAAGAQGKFWEMHDLLFARKQEWEVLSTEQVLTKMNDYAEELDLDVEKFSQELADGVYADKVQSQYEEARMLGLPGTPSFLFDNVLFPSDIGLSYQGLEAFLGILQNQDDLFFDNPPEMTVKADDVYEATLKTTKGDVVVQMLPDSAPTHVNNFLFLANEDWYDGSDFFFVQDNFVAVTGDPTNSTIGYPGYYCQGEQQGIFDGEGLMGMLANGQFFVTLGSEAEQLTGQFALIGKVSEGMDVLQALTRASPAAPSATPADQLETVEITQK